MAGALGVFELQGEPMRTLDWLIIVLVFPIAAVVWTIQDVVEAFRNHWWWWQ